MSTSGGAMSDLTSPTAMMLPGMGTVHPAVAQSPMSPPKITSSPSTPLPQLGGIGLTANQNLMKLPFSQDHMAENNAIQSTHTAPGLPVWQSAPNFTPITPST